jgi:pimeloyl-ACP methyl ester carboxylesterase
MPYARIGGLDLYYEDHGTGPTTLVIAHGALGSVAFAEAFGLSASALAQRGLRVVAYDARGHGRSGFSTDARDYDKQALASELRLLLDVLDLARVSLCGTSMGATSALLFALAHPERVDRLVLRSPAPFGADMMPARCLLHGLALSYQGLGTSLTARLASLRPGPDGAVRMRALLLGQRRASIVPALRGFLAAPLDTRGLDAIESPTLILTQQGDELHPLRSGEILYSLLPNATLCAAPTPTFWDRRLDDTADLIAAFVAGRDVSSGQIAKASPCAFKTKKRGPRRADVASSAGV